MKESTRKAREQRKHDEALAAILGISYEDVLAQRQKEAENDRIREAQAIHLFLERPDAFISKVCSNPSCGKLFLTSYQFVSLCSTTCRIESLEQLGINWNPMRGPEERWTRAQIPTEYSIPPEALQVLLQLAQDQQEKSQDCSTDEPGEVIPNTPLSSDDTQLDSLDELLQSIEPL
jgi:hypothetical protein